VHKLGPGVDLLDLQADRVYEPYANQPQLPLEERKLGVVALLPLGGLIDAGRRLYSAAAVSQGRAGPVAGSLRAAHELAAAG
jgi:hypothetical protein